MRVLLIGNYAHDGQESMQRFASMMLSGLREAGVDVELIAPQPVFGRLKKSGAGLGKWLGYIDKFLLFPIALRRKLACASIVHICDHSNGFYTRHLQDVPHIVTCHDLLAVRSARGEVPENPTRWSGRKLQAMIASGLQRAQHIVCISEATQADVLRLIKLPPARVSVIHNGLNYPYSPMPETEARPRVTPLLSGKSAPFILHVGGNQWYKNRPGVLRIYAHTVEIYPGAPELVMAGKSFTPEMREFIEAKNLTRRVHALEGCSNEDLRALYSTAEALLFPSLAEGQGWPVIEAQACRCPVLCGNREPFPEITRGSAALHDPTDETGCAQALKRLLTQPAERASLVERGWENARRFAPSAMIAQYLEHYRQICTAHRDSTTTPQRS
jgi:glycosyltransferase involved in cell wall biosynthesis